MKEFKSGFLIAIEGNDNGRDTYYSVYRAFSNGRRDELGTFSDDFDFFPNKTAILSLLDLKAIVALSDVIITANILKEFDIN